MSKYIFIIIRHVNNEITNEYWQECYKCIRKFYDNQILIIDDNSNQEFIKYDLDLVNCEIINSEYPQRGEMMSYYYFLNKKEYDKAIIIHDSVFIQEKINFEKNQKNTFLWHFSHNWDEDKKCDKIIKKFKNYGEILNFYHNKDKWYGCFGMMMVIHRDILELVDKKYDFFDTIKNNIKSRSDRMQMERILACVIYLNDDVPINFSLLGDIKKYCKWGYSWKEYKCRKIDVPIIKIWSGR